MFFFPFPHTDQTKAKLRPAVLVARVPGDYDDWLICMISTQLHHEVKGFDEIIQQNDLDFSASGLKTDSLLRLARLAVVESNLLMGSIGSISSERMDKISKKIAKWIYSGEDKPIEA